MFILHNLPHTCNAEGGLTILDRRILFPAIFSVTIVLGGFLGYANPVKAYNNLDSFLESQAPTPPPITSQPATPQLESSPKDDLVVERESILQFQDTEYQTLYDQTDEPDVTPPTGINSQNWESALDQFDVFAADDFVVPLGVRTWSIEQIEVKGFYLGASDRTPESINVFIYRDSEGLPGIKIYEAQEITAVGGLETGNFTIDLPTPATVTPGHYWLSVQVNLDFYPDLRQWFWQKREVQDHNESVLQNPLDGFRTGCTSWQPRVSVCGSTPGPDFLFRLLGVAEPVEPPTVSRSVYVNTRQLSDLEELG